MPPPETAAAAPLAPLAADSAPIKANGTAATGRKYHSARVPPVGHFLQLERGKRAALDAGHDVIDLSVGMSDMVAPPEALEALRAATHDPVTHTYSLKEASLELLGAACAWYQRRYGVQYDPRTEALSVIGAQEGLAHLLMAVADHGDSVLVLDACYPSYLGAMKVAGLNPSFITEYDAQTGLPLLDRISPQQLHRVRCLLLNYPNNPTSVTATPEFFAQAIEFCRRNGILFIHDNPYVDMIFDGGLAASPLALPGGREQCVEIFSFSKSYHLAGFRLGFVLGNADAIAALEAVKAPIDFNQNLAIQRMGVTCLHLPEARLRHDAEAWRDRAATLVRALHQAGWDADAAPMPKACMYVWARLPRQRPLDPSPPHGNGNSTPQQQQGGGPEAEEGARGGPRPPLEELVCGGDDRAFCRLLLAHTGVALGPGSGFGPGGRGYVRLALIVPPGRLEEAARRMGEFVGRLRDGAVALGDGASA